MDKESKLARRHAKLKNGLFEGFAGKHWILASFKRTATLTPTQQDNTFLPPERYSYVGRRH